MGTWNGADELGRAALSKEIAWHRFKERERKVRRDFWTALKQCSACLLHRSMAHRPLTWLWRGLAFTDDAAVVTALFGLASHIKPVHRAAAVRALGKDINNT
jgi:hypothetical protein